MYICSTIFYLYNRSTGSKVDFRHIRNHYKWVLKIANFVYAEKIMELKAVGDW